MKKIIKALAHPFHWIKESNRLMHLKCGFLLALFGTIMCTIGAAFALEFKDGQYGNKFDWLDIAATLIGGFFGQAAQLLLIWLLIRPL